MPVKLSYINARDEEIILDDDENTFAHELTGRTGAEMPQIETETVTYGDGSQDIISARMKPRTVTCYFWVDLDHRAEFERHLRDVKAKMMQVGSRSGDWGKLKIRQKDGTYLYLNCIYKSGFDALVRDTEVRLKFSLSFEATDPLFYNGYESTYTIQAPDDAEYLLMLPIDGTYDTVSTPITEEDENGDTVITGYNTSKVYDFSKDNITNNPHGLYMRQLGNTVHSVVYPTPRNVPMMPDFDDDTISNYPDAVYMKSASGSSNNTLELECQKIYPTITISGTAGNIRIVNKLTGKKIEIDGSVAADGGNYIYIRTQPLHRKAVLISTSTGAETNIMHYLSADSTLDFPLERGTNIITYRNTNVTPSSKCKFTYTEGWLDVV